jgi:UDP-N-acetyl-D-mannosaminuronic acid transferase (WecB/TagA/CpsF family)
MGHFEIFSVGSKEDVLRKLVKQAKAKAKKVRTALEFENPEEEKKEIGSINKSEIKE